MAKVYCFFHKNYDGTTPPDLTCSVCCSTYIERVTATQVKIREKEGFNAYKWMAKKHQRQDASIALASGIQPTKAP